MVYEGRQNKRGDVKILNVSYTWLTFHQSGFT